jgi:ABC-type sugar transport system permease subunit
MTRRAATREAIAAFGFLAPAYLFYLVFTFIPVCAVLVFAFTGIDRFTWHVEFVGLDNLRFVLVDARFWKSLANTFLFVSLAVTGNVGAGLILAVLLNRRLPGPILYLLRLAYFLPVLIATALVSLVWKFIYSTDLGALNYYVQASGLPKVGWLTDRHVAMLSIVIMDVWKHFGFFMVILLAALQSVPRGLIEAAALDGARPLRVFLSVQLPVILPVLLFCATYATITGLQVFESIRILTAGGPGDATNSMVMYMFEQTFGAQDVGAGSASALVLLLVIVAVTIVQLRASRHLARE